MTSYYLNTGYLDQTAYLLLSEKEYSSLKESYTVLLNISEIEEKYSLLMHAYSEFEKEILNITFDYSISGKSFFENNHNYNRERLNLKIMSVMTAIRLFHDKTPRWLEKISFEDKSKFKESTNIEFDSFLEYRFIEKFRNYAQHYQSPIDVIRYGRQWTEDFESLDYKLGVISLKKKLDASGIFSKELVKTFPDEIDIKHMIRSYISSINTIMSKLRSSTDEKFQRSANDFRLYIKEYEDNFGNSISLKAEKYAGEKVEESFNINENLLDFTHNIRNRNRSSINLRKIRYIS